MISDKEAIHLICGDSAAMSIRNAFKLKRDQIVVCRDELSLGRQILTADYEQWQLERQEDLSDLFGDELVDDYLAKYGDASFGRFDLMLGDCPILIWSDGLLSTQLMTAFVCYQLTENGLGTSQLHIGRYHDPQSKRTFAMLGAMGGDSLIRNRAKATALSQSEVVAYADIWRLFCSEDPLNHYKLATDASFLNLTENALAALIRRYPEKATGFDGFERMLVEAAIEHAANVPAKAALVIGHVLCIDETPDIVGDTYLYERLLEMGEEDLPHPLFHFEFEGADFRMPYCKTRILPIAHDILAGRANMIALNGIDQWIGGVHLTPDDVVWREDLATSSGK